MTAREIEVAVLGNTAPETSVPGEILPGSEFYDYEDKYVTGAAKLAIPADLPADEIAKVRELAVDSFLALRCAGLARVDFFYEENGRGWLLNEINTIPGFTPARCTRNCGTRRAWATPTSSTASSSWRSRTIAAGWGSPPNTDRVSSGRNPRR